MTSEDKNKIVEEIIQEMKKEGIPVLINHGSVRPYCDCGYKMKG